MDNDKVIEALARIETQVRINGDEIRRLRNVIDGDGSPGMATRLAMLEKASAKSGAVAGGLVGSLAVLLAALYDWFIA